MESIPEEKSPILVVDDDPGLLLLIKTTLVSSGMPEPALTSDSRRVMDLIRSINFRLYFWISICLISTVWTCCA